MTKDQLRAKYGDEMVLVVPRKYYEAALHVKKNPITALLDTIESSGFLSFRWNVEDNEDVLQVIPYMVLKNNDKYFITKRLGGDERLIGQAGFLGGHVNKCDIKPTYDGRRFGAINALLECANRELCEETTYGKPIKKYKFVDVFTDNSSQVSRCHVCMLMEVQISNKDAKALQIKETDNLEGAWVTLDELGEMATAGKMESWAEIATRIELMKEIDNNDTSN